MSDVNYAIYGCSFREQLQEKQFNWRKNIVAIVIQDKVLDDNLKREIKN